MLLLWLLNLAQVRQPKFFTRDYEVLKKNIKKSLEVSQTRPRLAFSCCILLFMLQCMEKLKDFATLSKIKNPNSKVSVESRNEPALITNLNQRN